MIMESIKTFDTIHVLYFSIFSISGKDLGTEHRHIDVFRFGLEENSTRKLHFDSPCSNSNDTSTKYFIIAGVQVSVSFTKRAQFSFLGTQKSLAAF